MRPARGRRRGDEAAHAYTSTACLHQLHDRCPHTCRWCQAPCGCPCHPAGDRAPRRPGPLPGAETAMQAPIPPPAP